VSGVVLRAVYATFGPRQVTMWKREDQQRGETSLQSRLEAEFRQYGGDMPLYCSLADLERLGERPVVISKAEQFECRALAR
jgi:hypothetical protein